MAANHDMTTAAGRVAARLDAAGRTRRAARAIDTDALIVEARTAGISAAEIARRLDVTESYAHRIWRQHQKAADDVTDDAPTVRVAYDFGDTLHVMDIDAQGVHDPDSVEVLDVADGDRDAALDSAGYRPLGNWAQQGEAEGVTVERAQ